LKRRGVSCRGAEGKEWGEGVRVIGYGLLGEEVIGQCLTVIRGEAKLNIEHRNERR
jgi:hypothetical protein